MKFACQLQQQTPGTWNVRYEGADLGSVEVTAASREEALTKMRDELRFRLEYCPCSGEMYRDVEIEIGSGSEG